MTALVSVRMWMFLAVACVCVFVGGNSVCLFEGEYHLDSVYLEKEELKKGSHF